MTVAPAPSEHRRITRGAILKRLLAVAVAGLALYGLAPELVEVLGDGRAYVTSSLAGSR